MIYRSERCILSAHFIDNNFVLSILWYKSNNKKKVLFDILKNFEIPYHDINDIIMMHILLIGILHIIACVFL